MTMPGRQYVTASPTTGGYRFGFNGMEKDGEAWSGSAGNQLDFGARIYDSRLGRWLSVDPQAGRFSAWSPYHAMMNNPIWMIDPDGEQWDFSNLQVTYDKQSQSIRVTGEVTVKYTVLNLTDKAIGINDIEIRDFVIPHISYDDILPIDLSGNPNISSDGYGSPTVRFEVNNLKINVEFTNVISDVNQVMPDDHVLIIANNIDTKAEDNGIISDAAGVADKEGNIAAVLENYINNHTPTHEVAHNLGTDDWKIEDNALPGYLMSYADNKNGYKLTNSDKINIVNNIVFEYSYENANYCEPNGSKEKTKEFIEQTGIK
ncbi:MAG: hypothetical protein H6578_00570 [Chitinophagales bacterium]|nr:hypothetical protein [Chitinophagales bacterium]